MDPIGAEALILQTASSILTLGENCYKASVPWDEYRQRLSVLCQDHKEFTWDLVKFGFQLHHTTDANLRKRLEAAASSLGVEEARLRRLQNIARYCVCYTKFSIVAFPDHLSLSIQSAEQALDDVRKLFRLREENDALLKKAVLSKPFSARISHDPLYVHLEEIESKVYEVLEDPSKPTVVLLHGGPGRGKSTLARHIASHYKEKHRPLSTGTGAPEDQEKSKFDHVFYLECGPKADVRAKQLELLQYLGPSGSMLQGEDGNSGACTSGDDLSVLKLLRALLSEQEVLIILDDVWKTEFLEIFVEVFGRKMKCLVTSQNARLWNNCSSIEIRVNSLEANSILARHARLPNNDIPPKLQNIFDRIVKETEGHPLALASLTTAINNERATDIDEWREAEKSLLKLLKEEDTVSVYNRSTLLVIKSQPVSWDKEGSQRTWSQEATRSDPQAVELKVPICCKGCEEKLDGLESVKMDSDSSKVTITGKVNPEKCLKVAKKIVKRSELWPKKKEEGQKGGGDGGGGGGDDKTK